MCGALGGAGAVTLTNPFSDTWKFFLNAHVVLVVFRTIALESPTLHTSLCGLVDFVWVGPFKCGVGLRRARTEKG